MGQQSLNEEDLEDDNDSVDDDNNPNKQNGILLLFKLFK
jgi:hypothetical protein